MKGYIVQERIICDFDDDANKIFSKNLMGVKEETKLVLSYIEALYLMYKKKLTVFSLKEKELLFDDILKLAKKANQDLWPRFCAYKDMRDRGYIVKTALKFGADFRIYDKGVKPGEDHAKWILFPVSETTKFSWYDFAAKSRVAHSTKKRLLIGLVDEESDVTYYEIAWKRP
ncbi:tRNA-intron lyase [Candidatus Woesearchaeota archaeon]|nr:tRNA-intron lyase [Candidatus Woesearchaeota archaeon]